MLENRPGATVHFGQEATDQFRSCLNSFFQDDATGKVYGAYRCEFSELRMVGMTMCRSEAIADAISNTERIGELDKYEMIVIDSGNSHGDSWVATFYPRQCVMTFVDQLVPRQKHRQCMSCGGSEDAGFRDGQCGACAGHSEDNASLPTKQEVQRNQMECMTAVPTLPTLESKYNNASVKSTCPVCRDVFKPSIGDWDFLAGTMDPVCEYCSSEIHDRQKDIAALNADCRS